MKIGIIGLGLIGGSLALSIKNKSETIKILAYNRTKDVLKLALNSGAIDEYTEKIDGKFADCDVIYICLPVANIDEAANELSKFTTTKNIVTDVGSTKTEIVKSMEKYKDLFTFIGGHPMAGSEQIGFENAKRYMFENAYYIFTKENEQLMDIAKTIGSIPIILAPEIHDIIVGAISHVPHVIAMSLVNAVKKSCGDKDAALTLAAGGFKDITRIASSSPKMWQDISMQNRENILDILDVFKKELTAYEDSLINRDEKSIYSHFSSAKTYREEFKANKSPLNSYIIRTDIEDKPGAIALVATVLTFHNINIKNIGIANSRDFEKGILEIIVENANDKIKGSEVLKNNGLEIYE